jgi:hypothetical protein
MNHNEAQLLLDDLVDGTLSAYDRNRLEAHLSECALCTEEVERLRSLILRAQEMPKSIPPPDGVWQSIAAQLPRQPLKLLEFSQRTQDSHRTPRNLIDLPLVRAASLAAALAVAFGGYWFALRSPRTAWDVERIAGAPTIDHQPIASAGRIFEGNWLETDSRSSARITVADIGHVELGPNSRLRLLNTQAMEHRLELAQGSVHASVSSPPRIFIVETPSATAVDLGCAYDLNVDEEGNSILHVTAGEVSLEFNGRTAYVPAFAMCETRRGIGPGTPYSEESSPEFRKALSQFDFDGGSGSALNSILTRSGSDDAISLWHLIPRTIAVDRERVVDRLASFYPLPRGVAREGVLRLDSKMLDEWLGEFVTRIVFIEPVSINTSP